MRRITTSELKKNLAKYMALSQSEDVYITKNGKPYSVLKSAKSYSQNDFFSLFGCLKEFDDGRDYKETLAEEIEKHESAH